MLNVIRENRNTLCIKIDRSGEMQIKAPKRMPLCEILDYVNKNEQWIEKKQGAIREVLRINEPVLSYNKFLYLGNSYNAVLVNYLKDVKIEDNNLLIPDKFAAKRADCVAKWLKKQALSVIESRVLYISKTFNISFGALRLKNLKSSWGSCERDGAISFNWRLVMLPPNAIDYVIIHELAHLFEFNHSTKYWSIVGKMLPSYKREREILKNCSYILQLFN